MSIKIDFEDDVLDVVDKVKRGLGVRFVALGADEGFTKLSIKESSEDMSLTVEQIRDTLPRDDARYVIMNFDYEIEDGKRSKTMKIMWIGEKSKLKTKMTFASASGSTGQKINANVSCDARDLEDFSSDNFRDKCERI